MPSGKTAYHPKDSFSNLATKVAEVIDSRPDEQFLVVYHRMPESISRDLPRAVQRLLMTESERIKFLHWGIHNATNRFVGIPNVILAGILQYSNADYEALARAAAGKTTSQRTFGRTELNDVRLGETSHHILQAATRGKIRVSRDGSCPDTNLWVIAPRNAGVSKLLPTLFPGCRIRECDHGREEGLQGKSAQAYEFLKSCKDSGMAEVPLREVLTEIQVKDWYTFNRDIYDKIPAFRAALRDLQFKLLGKGRHRKFAHARTFDGESGDDVIENKHRKRLGLDRLTPVSQTESTAHPGIIAPPG